MKKVSIKKYFDSDSLVVENEQGQSMCIEINEEKALLIIAELAKYLLDKKGAEDAKN